MKTIWKRLIVSTLICCMLLGCSKKNDTAVNNEVEIAGETENFENSVEDNKDTEETGIEYRYTGNADYSRMLAKSSQVYLPGDSKIIPIATDTPNTVKDYTIMIYMIGSNLESQYGSASKDLIEIQNAGIDYSKCNVLVYTGGSLRWLCGVPCDRNSVLDMSRPEGERIVAQTEGNADMGVPDTLSAFINYCNENYPAEHNGLIFWDHGGGSLWGYGADELFDNDSLLLSEMQTAMNASPYGGERRLDFVGFDACLMASLECMNTWSRYSDYYVGSEELEPGEGWDYGFLNVLNRTTDTEEITKHLIKCYSDYYESVQSEFYNPDLTLSCVDLSKIDSLLGTLKPVFSGLISEIENGNYSEIQKIRTGATEFGRIETKSDGDSDTSYDLIDVGDYINALSDIIPDESKDLLDKLDEFVLESYSNIEGSSGVSLYYPFYNKGQYYHMASTYESISVSPIYTDFIDSLQTKWLGGKQRDWKLGNIKKKDGNLFLQLTPDQQENVTAAYYTVFARGGGSYIPIFERCLVEIDSAGIMHIPDNPQIVCIENNMGSSRIWGVEQINKSIDRPVFKTINTRLRSDQTITTYSIGSSGHTFPDVSFVMTTENDKDLVIQTVISDSVDIGISGKDSVDATEFEGIYQIQPRIIPLYDEKGQVLSYKNWYDENNNYINKLGIDESFRFSLENVDELLDTYCIQFEIEDTSGCFYSSDIVEIESQSIHIKEETVSDGNLSYKVFRDHAVLVSYDGTDSEIQINDMFEGTPVTMIGSAAFSGAINLESITLPNTIETIGDSAFANCFSLKEIEFSGNLISIGDEAFFGCGALEKIQLPFGVKHIGKCSFGYCENLREIDIPETVEGIGDGVFIYCKKLESITVDHRKDGECEGLILNDGVIFSKNRDKLIVFPANSGKKYTVPNGTMIIGYGAFSSSSLEEILFNDDLIKIENCAFRDAENLKIPVLPQKLNHIGDLAFGSCFRIGVKDNVKLNSDETHTILIGEEVDYIGKDAFSMFTNKVFEVDDNNPFYSSVEGNLCNKKGDSIIDCAIIGDAVINIPNGIISFDCDMLSQYNSLSYYMGKNIEFIDVFFPESVERLYSIGSITGVYFHCVKGSAAESYAEKEGIPYDDITEQIIGKAELETPHGILRFNLYDNHAELISYEGTDRVLEIPEKVNGVPVTVIGDGLTAVQSVVVYDTIADEDLVDQSKYIKEVVIPEGIQEIRNQAFSTSWPALEEINLPDSLRIIGDYACIMNSDFVLSRLPSSLEYLGSSCLQCKWEGDMVLPKSLKAVDPLSFDKISPIQTGEYMEFIVESGNTCFSVKDGFLYDYQGEEMIIAPWNLEGTVVIPDGTLSIGGNAFVNSKEIESIDFNDELQYIGEYAFIGCKIKDLNIPSGVQKIGNSAFALCPLESLELNEGLLYIGSGAFREVSNQQVGVHSLPDSLREIEPYAFEYDWEKVEGMESASFYFGTDIKQIDGASCIYCNNFIVSEENPYYSAIDGMLTDKNNNILYCCPMAKEGEVTVPEGIVVIKYGCFTNAKNVSKLIIPDSVINISDTLHYEYEQGERKYNVTIYCHKGSYAEKYALDNGIPYQIIE